MLATRAEMFQDDFQPSLNLENRLFNQLINQFIWVSLIAFNSVLALFSRRSFPKEDKDEQEGCKLLLNQFQMHHKYSFQITPMKVL